MTADFELSNKQREYFGLDHIRPDWTRVSLSGDSYRPESVLFFDGDVIKRHIISTETEYRETHYDVATQNRELILPVTSKGKPKKLTAATLESRTPVGVYLLINKERLLIGNNTTQTTFYDSSWEGRKEIRREISEVAQEFIDDSDDVHVQEIDEFKSSSRKRVRISTGDIFAFKINRTEFGFGKVLVDVVSQRKLYLLPDSHGLCHIMAHPVLIKLYAHISSQKYIKINDLHDVSQLPSDYVMDNVLLYGEYEVIGNSALNEGEYDFPISFGRSMNASTPKTFLQWGLIHLEKSADTLSEYVTGENLLLPPDHPSRKMHNPYGYYSLGFRPMYGSKCIKQTIENGGRFKFSFCDWYSSEFDLRNPKNSEIRRNIMKTFGLNPDLSYKENCALTNTPEI